MNYSETKEAKRRAKMALLTASRMPLEISWKDYRKSLISTTGLCIQTKFRLLYCIVQVRCCHTSKACQLGFFRLLLVYFLDLSDVKGHNRWTT